MRMVRERVVEGEGGVAGDGGLHDGPGGDARQYRLVLLGAGEAGKTSLAWRFMHGRFLSRYHPTVEDSYRHLVRLPDGRYKSVEILDTAGMHQFPAMRELSIKSGQAFVVVYAVNSRASFDEALDLVKLVLELKQSPRSIPMILVGNKQDVPSELREVTAEEGALMAAQNHCAFVETSALRDVNVHDLFLQLLHRGFESAPPPTLNNEVTPVLSRGGARSTRRKLGRSRSAGLMAAPTGASPVVSTNESGRSGSRALSRGTAGLGPRNNSASARQSALSEFDEDAQGRCVIL